MAENEGRRPFWQELLDPSEGMELKSDLKRSAVGPLAYIGALVEVAGVDDDGGPNVPATKALYERLLSLPTSVAAKRAQLAAETMQKERFRPRRPARAWNPDHGLYDAKEAAEGDESGEGYNPRGL